MRILTLNPTTTKLWTSYCGERVRIQTSLDQWIDHMIEKEAHVLFIYLCYCIFYGYKHVGCNNRIEKKQESLVVEYDEI